MTTATKTQEVTFISFLHDQLVTIVPDRQQFATDPAGNLVKAGIQKGKHAQFKNRKFTTDDPEVIAVLRNHDRFNTKRGWREDFDSARPSIAERIDAVTEAAATADSASLRELIEDEASCGDGGRAEVLGPARKALERLEAVEQAAADLTEAEGSEPVIPDDPTAEAVTTEADGDPGGSA